MIKSFRIKFQSSRNVKRQRFQRAFRNEKLARRRNPASCRVSVKAMSKDDPKKTPKLLNADSQHLELIWNISKVRFYSQKFNQKLESKGNRSNANVVTAQETLNVVSVMEQVFRHGLHERGGSLLFFRRDDGRRYALLFVGRMYEVSCL